MTENPSPFAVSIQLTPSEEMVLHPNDPLRFEDTVRRSAYEYTILIRPGDPSPILLQLQNQGTLPLTLSLELQVEGYFLPGWLKIVPEAQHLEPGERGDASIYFELPNDFLEDSFVYSPEKLQGLEYRAFLRAWAILEPANALLESIPLNLAIRPQSLYLNFLPVFYSEVDFMGRFLAIFEKAFEPSVQMLEMFADYLDPLTAPSSLLPFLAQWVAWPIDARWDESQQRRLIRHAVETYRWRGTRRGLRLFLHFYTGLPLDEAQPEPLKKISIEEVFTEGFVLNASLLGQDTVLGGGKPFHFIVRLRSPNLERLNVATIRQIIEREKPAFCTYDLYLEEIVATS
jgi:phage tail-like protein